MEREGERAPKSAKDDAQMPQKSFRDAPTALLLSFL